MNILEIIQKLDEQFIPSTTFSILHAMQNAYNSKKTSGVGSTIFRNCVATVVLAFGGGIITNFLLGNPQFLFFSSTSIPIYCGLAILFSLFPSVFERGLDSIPSSFRTSYFNVIDALSRGYTLPRFLSYLRMVETPNGQCSLIGQLILAVVSITGGGLLYGHLLFRWCFQNRPWRIGGWAFNWICIISLLNLIFFEILDSHPDRYILYELRILLETNNLLLGIAELKLVNSILIFLAFSTNHGASKMTRKEFAAPPATDKKSKTSAENASDEEIIEEDAKEPETPATKSKKTPTPKKTADTMGSSSPRRTRRSTASKRKNY